MRKIILLTCFSIIFSLFGIDDSLPFGFNHTVYYSFTKNESINILKYKQKYKETMDYAAKANVGWWRAMGKFEWGSVQPEGPESWNWSDEDSLVKWSGERGLHILAVLGCHRITPKWAANKKISNYNDFGKCYPPDSSHLNDYHTFVKTLVERYDGDGIDDMPGLFTPIKYWEFTNEPYLKYFWGTPEQFIDMFKRTREAIKEADPEANIVGPCLTSSTAQPFKWLYYNIEKDKVDTTFFTDWIEMEKYILKGIVIENLDIISHHLYQNPTNFVNSVNELRELIQYNFRTDKPIWITEWGEQCSDGLEVNYKNNENIATCIYSSLEQPFFGKVTAYYGSYRKTIIDTFLYLGDTVILIDMGTSHIDTLNDFQGGTIINKNGDTVLQKGDTVEIFHIFLKNINHSYERQAQIYEQLLYKKSNREFLNNLKVFFFCVDNWTHNRYYPPEIRFGDDKTIKLYRVKLKDHYTIIDPDEGPQKAYYILKGYIKNNFQ